MAKNKDVHSNQISYRIGYRRGRTTAINAACKWLKENLSEGYDADNYPMVRCYDIDMEDFIKDFRKAMEE